MPAHSGHASVRAITVIAMPWKRRLLLAPAASTLKRSFTTWKKMSKPRESARDLVKGARAAGAATAGAPAGRTMAVPTSQPSHKARKSSHSGIEPSPMPSRSASVQAVAHARLNRITSTSLRRAPRGGRSVSSSARRTRLTSRARGPPPMEVTRALAPAWHAREGRTKKQSG